MNDRINSIFLLIALVVLAGYLLLAHTNFLAMMKEPVEPYIFQGMNHIALEKTLRETEGNISIFIYRNDCDSACGTQLKALQEMETPGTTDSPTGALKEGADLTASLILVSFDDSTAAAQNFLELNGITRENAGYYVPLNAKESLKEALVRHGSAGIETIPHTLFFDENGELIHEMSGFSSASTMRHTVNNIRQYQ